MSMTSTIAGPSRWRHILERILWIRTNPQLEEFLGRVAHQETTSVLAFVNAHAMNSVLSSSSFFDALRAADILVRDGSGMASICRILSLDPGLNLNGTDLIPRIIRLFDTRGIALFGTRAPYLGKARAYIHRRLAPSSDLITEHGFNAAEYYVGAALAHRPALIVLGMGMPKQEEVAVTLRSALPYPCLIVCGGAIIDFLGGKIPRAPVWMQKAGIEWIFRLALEPRRLFRRYVIGNLLFLARALLYKNQLRPSPSPAPGKKT